MSAIVPAILPTSHEDLEQKLAQLQGLVQDVQIDVIDGRFATPASWPYSDSTYDVSGARQDQIEFPYLGRMHYEMDLMVSDPELMNGAWIASGAERLTLHLESSNYLPRAIKELEIKYGHAKDFAPSLLSLGLAINIATDLSLLEPFLENADYVQFMGIKTIGRQGEPFDQRVLRKIATFHRAHPSISMQVDGGVSLRTAPALLSAGVERLIIGSALWKAPNLAEELGKFHDLAQEYGIYS